MRFRQLLTPSDHEYMPVVDRLVLPGIVLLGVLPTRRGAASGGQGSRGCRDRLRAHARADADGTGDVSGPLALTWHLEMVAVIGTASWVVLGVLVWSGSGVTAAIVLSRRGHDLRSLLGLALVFGPLFVPLAVDYVRRREPAVRPIVLCRTPPAERGADIVVVVLGDGHDAADASAVLDRFGPVGAVTIATPIDFQTAERPADDPGRVEADRRLAAAATLLHDPPPGRVLLPGTLEEGLRRFVRRHHDLVVVTGAVDDWGVERASATLGLPVVLAPSTTRRR